MGGGRTVTVRRETVVIPTYEPLPPDKNPMFLDTRVYQGSSGKVYPLPFTDRVSTTRTERKWHAIYLENEFLQVMLLPEIGGRIHAILDKTSGYDAVYRQDVIKPALVGLAGPWISGGIEFNWPQHHRPTTFMPVNVAIEKHPDGSVTVWMSEHEPMNRMKGMHGVCLHPGKSRLEVKVRLYNRTPITQTFLWWANAGVKVDEHYQSFFPPDVQYVTDHAKRAVSRFPLCDGQYYGVDYVARAQHGLAAHEMPRRFVPLTSKYAANDLSWYANIPVPTSYMCTGSKQDFFGGYDHARQCGIVHVADHHISPGKKQWTWGNHDFGYAWDRNLSADSAPYIELMAGVYTDNQPDFSFLMPGETKSFSQYWYPIRDIGPAHHANLDAAISLTVERSAIRIAVAATSVFEDAAISLTAKGNTLFSGVSTIAPNRSFKTSADLPPGIDEFDLKLTVIAADGKSIIAYQPSKPVATDAPSPASEPATPSDVKTIDELGIIAAHLEQYRHATRSPEPYWREALRRDPMDSRCNNALGMWRLRRGEFVQAAERFSTAIQRLTSRNPNPADGEPYYNLGVALRYLSRDDEAYDAFYKATWNYAWQSAGYLALAEIDCRRGNWESALEHLDRSLKVNAEHLWARNLKAMVLRKLGRDTRAQALLRATNKLDRLNFAAHWLLGRKLSCDTQVRLDLSLDFARAGFYAEAIDLLSDTRPEATPGTLPLLSYYKGYFLLQMGEHAESQNCFVQAAGADRSYCFPSRLEEILILQAAIEINPHDAAAPYYLANLLYDRKRHEEAMPLWEKAVALDPMSAIAWRNLGIAYFNAGRDRVKASAAFDCAIAAAPRDARILFERDQLWKRTGVTPRERLAELQERPALVAARDDLSVEICDLYNLVGEHARALDILSTRHFRPWEGGEGQVVAQHVRTHLALGRKELKKGNLVSAQIHAEAALTTPANLGEAKHLHSNQADTHYFMGLVYEAAGEIQTAAQYFSTAARYAVDFQGMSVKSYSEMTYYSAMALRKLDRSDEADARFVELLKHARTLRHTTAKIDYFATSLPSMLLFEDDLQRSQETTAMFLEAQALVGLGELQSAREILEQVLQRDPSRAMGAELLSEIAVESTMPSKRRGKPRDLMDARSERGR